MKFKPPPKRKKVDTAASDSSAHSTSAVSSLEKQDAVMMLIDKSTVQDTHMNRVNPRIRQARDFALVEAQQNGCMTNFRIFDSPYGNYLVPVIPTRAELAGIFLQRLTMKVDPRLDKYPFDPWARVSRVEDAVGHLINLQIAHFQ